jgi:hypothetical protein
LKAFFGKAQRYAERSNHLISDSGRGCLDRQVEHHLPAGEWRAAHASVGYQPIIDSRESSFSDVECTGATAGQLLHRGHD